MKRIILTCIGICLFVSLACGEEKIIPSSEEAGEAIAEQGSKFMKGIGEGLQKEGKKTGESMAKGVDEVAKGVGEGLKEDGEATGENVAEGVGNVLKGVLKGLDKALLEITVDGDESLKSAGISIAKSEQQINDNRRPAIITYLKYKKDFKGKLQLEVFDDSNVSMEKGYLTIEGTKGETGKAVFEFGSDTKVTFPGLRYTLSVAK